MKKKKIGMSVTRTKHKYDQTREHEYDKSERVGGKCAACSYTEFFRNLRRCKNPMHVAKTHSFSITYLFERVEPPEHTAADTSPSCSNIIASATIQNRPAIAHS